MPAQDHSHRVKSSKHHPTHQAFVLVVCCAIALAACAPAATTIPTQPPTSTPLPPTKVPAAIPSPLPTLQVTFRLDKIPDLEQFLDAKAEGQGWSGAALVIHQGKVVLSRGFGYADRAKKIANTPQTRFRIAALTTTFTTMAILILKSQGKLDFKDSICPYFTGCPAAWKDITIHHLLTHTSGIPDDLPDDMYYRTPPTSQAQLIADFKDLPLKFQPGSQHAPITTGYGLLGSIIEKASGMTYEEFLQKSIFTPLKMVNTGLVNKTTSGLAPGYPGKTGDPVEPYDHFFTAADGMYSTVEDLALWDQALDSEKLVSKDLLNAMFTPWVNYQKAPDENSNDYFMGYGWRIVKYRGMVDQWLIASVPGYSARFDRDPQAKYTTIFLFNNKMSSSDLTQALGTAMMIPMETR